MRSGVFTTLSVSYGWMFWLTPVQLIEDIASCERVMDTLPSRTAGQINWPSSGLVNRHRPSASAQKNFDGVTPSATEDKQVTGEGIIIQHMLYLFSQSVEGFTHIGNAGNEPDTGT